jgi:hypothetical protein
MSWLAFGVRVRCLARKLKECPRYGWLGTVMSVEREEEFFIVNILWDELCGARAGGAPLHHWVFQDEGLAAEYLEVVSAGAIGNA